MEEAIDKNGFGYLHIEPKHTAALTTLPPIRPAADRPGDDRRDSDRQQRYHAGFLPDQALLVATNEGRGNLCAHDVPIP